METDWVLWGVLAVLVVGAVVALLRRMGRLGNQFETGTNALRADLIEKLLREFAQTQDRVGESLRIGRVEQNETLDRVAKNLETRFRELREATEKKLTEVRGEVDKKLGETVSKNAEHFKAVGDQLTKLGESTGKIISLSTDVRDLNVLLKAPKSRGAFGEMGLEQMLADILGDFSDLFASQYSLGDGNIADAAIFITPDHRQVVCIDAKFPRANAEPLLGTVEDPAQLEAFRKAFIRDVRIQATSIRDKYIRPPRTLDYAFMYVPAESIFYLILREAKLHEELLRMHVVPVGPNTFYATLNAFSYMYRGIRIQQNARELVEGIARLGTEFERFAKDYKLVGTHLSNANSKFEDTRRDIERFTERIARLKQADLASDSQEPPLIAAQEPTTE